MTDSELVRSLDQWRGRDDGLDAVMDIAGHNRWDTTKKYAVGMGRAQELGVQAIQNMRQRYRHWLATRR
jgi:hypothetical protein